MEGEKGDRSEDRVQYRGQRSWGLQSRPLQSSLGADWHRVLSLRRVCGVTLGVVAEDIQEKNTCPTSQPGGSNSSKNTGWAGAWLWAPTSGPRPRARMADSWSQEPHLSCPSHASVGVIKWSLTSRGGKVGAKKKLQPFLSPGLC